MLSVVKRSWKLAKAAGTENKEHQTSGEKHRVERKRKEGCIRVSIKGSCMMPYDARLDKLKEKL